MIFGLEFPGSVVTLGAITGMTYGMLAVGLVLIYRSNRIVNFAHGEIGAFGAALLGVAVVQWGLPYWVAFAIALSASGAIGSIAEVTVVRRLRNAPSLMSFVGTLGLAQVLLFFSAVVNNEATAGRVYPQPAGLPSFSVGALRITPAYFAMLFITPVLVAGLAIFMRRARAGLGIRASAANPDTARLSGVSAGQMSMVSWAIAGAVSAYTAILIRPTIGFISSEALGPGLLLRAMAAAVIARMTSLPVALAAGVVLGVVEQELLWNYPSAGLVEVTLFVVILVALLTQRRRGGREEEKGSWLAVQPWRPFPPAFLRVPSIRRLGSIAAVLGFGVALLLAIVATNAATIRLILIVGFALVGLSTGIVTGLGGQLSLGQFAIAGVGAVVSYHVVAATGNFLLAFAAAAGAAAAVSILVGLPAVRVRGLMLAVATLSFALATSAWAFQQPWALGEGVEPGRPIIGSLALESAKSYYLFAVGLLTLGLWFARNVWRGGVGRRLRAVRDNEDGARAFTIPAARVKLHGFALAGLLAGLGGALYGHTLSRLGSSAFPIEASVGVVAMAALGGIGLLAGPIIGALYIVGVPRFLPLDNAGLAATAFGWLLLILIKPGGFAQLFAPARDRIAEFLARRAGVDAGADDSPDAVAERFAAGLRGDADERAASASLPTGTVLLEAAGMRKRYGGLVAVDDVTLRVHAGETLGLIGPNGAGKTTLFELLSGFLSADAGRVVFAGRDVSRLGPEARGRLGIIRSFQDASLFPTLTVVEALELAQERVAPTHTLRSALGLHGQERRKRERAAELLAVMGLEPFATKQINELSTGTRRITELACVLALSPTLLLLDEPSSGIAQRETEALGELLVRLKARLGTTMVVIEHDMPLIMSISDRIVAMESGMVIAEGTPEAVRADPLVLESYLGFDPAAIQRSSFEAVRR